MFDKHTLVALSVRELGRLHTTLTTMHGRASDGHSIGSTLIKDALKTAMVDIEEMLKTKPAAELAEVVLNLSEDL